MNGRYRQLMVVAALWFAASLAVPAAQTNVIITLPPGLQLVREKRDQPPQDLFVVTVDLKNPQVAVRVSPGGPDPDGPGEYQTTLMTVRAVAERDGYDVAVNGDFFSAKRTVDAHGNESGYLTGLWAKLTGAAMTDGKLWTGGAQPALWISRHGRASISRGGGGKAPPHCWQVISGHPLLVEDGRAVPSENHEAHPRTAVGVDTTGTKLILLVVDGRHPQVATGMTHAELSRELLRLGCAAGLNLDGGGSATLVIRDTSTGKLRVINTPSDHRERPVANVLGIKFRPENVKP